jgi:hypothetical protein
MITITGNGRLTRDIELRSTHSGKSVATISLASDRRDRQAPGLFVDLVVWERQAEAAAEHLVKGQAVSFSGRFEPRASTPPAAARSAWRWRSTTSRSSTGPSPAPPSLTPPPRSRPAASRRKTTTFRFDRRRFAGPRSTGGPASQFAPRGTRLVSSVR